AAAPAGKSNTSGVPVATVGRCPGRRPGAGSQGGTVPVAERQRRAGGDTPVALQSTIRPVDAG
ncbi:hypothetical protein KZ288_27685, partial [Escherichia coli]|nr:hypothetical protein [Escherichia coli]